MRLRRSRSPVLTALVIVYVTLVGACGLWIGLWFALRTEMAAGSVPAPQSTVAPAASGGVAEVTPTAAAAAPQPTTATPRPTPARPPATRPPTRIVAPAIRLDAPVVEATWQTTYLAGQPVVEWQVPAHAAGFHQGSAYPGQPGNTVISGHNNIAGQVFVNLANLQIDDEVTLYVDTTPYGYIVYQREILPEKGLAAAARIANAGWIAPTADERLTLVSCWPYTSNTHRVIVVARPAP
ncbi:MAG TPA: sortase [Anaerolineae bacterium]|nr:sortase [Anaerolineae bacterium]HOQ98355.1 sortase [Anaerolineae bacterium]HPL26589.1 sortase [Anaerolineae bacterium]